MSDALATIYSRSDAFKRKLIDALRNPRLAAEQVVGDANDRARGLNEMTSAAASEGADYGPASKALAGKMAEGYNPVGMTKVVGPQSEALETARKNAVKMLRLPENNTPMDRAKALGFDADVLHGTSSTDIRAVNTQRGRSAKPFYVTENAGPEAAEFSSNFAMTKPELGAPTVYPMMMRSSSMVDARKEIPEALKHVDLQLSGKGLPKWSAVDDWADTAKSSGVGGVLLDERSHLNSVAVLDPKNIRSRFAAFDPARANEPDLLAGMLPLGAMALPKDEKGKKKDNPQEMINALRKRKPE